MNIAIGIATGEETGPSQLVSVAKRSAKGLGAPAGIIAALADDLSGSENGREAARLALYALVHGFREQPPELAIPSALMRALESANDAVCKIARKGQGGTPIGVSMVAAFLSSEGLYWTAVGDSRLHCLRRGELSQLTHEQTSVRGLRARVMREELTLADLERHAKRNTLTSYLGVDPIPEIDATVKPFPLDPGDKLLLSTAGLGSVLTAQRIAKTLVFDAQTAADELVAIADACASGKHRDFHAAVLSLPEPERPPEARRRDDSETEKPWAGFPGVSGLAGRFSRIQILAIAGLAALTLTFAMIALYLYLNEPNGQRIGPDPEPGLQTPSAPEGPPLPDRPLQYRNLPVRP